MFQRGQKIECIYNKEVNVCLEKGKEYIVLEHTSPDKCVGELANHPAEWVKNGGRVEVDQFPGCYWYGRRFKTVA